jgi:Uma2 family endonuclease
MATAVQPLDVLELLPAPGEWTELDYYPLSEQGRLVELSAGNIEVLPLPTDFHQLIILRLCLAIHTFVTPKGLGQVRFAPLPVRLWSGKVREPDVIFLLAEHKDRIGKYWGVPDLAVEVISEGTEHKDREVKRREYAQAGVTEYWIVDQIALTVEVCRLTASGEYGPSIILDSNASLETPLIPGFSVNLAEIFAPA